MKRLLALILSLLICCAPVPAFAAAAHQSASSSAGESAFDEALFSGVRAALAGEEVLSVSQIAVVFSQNAERVSASGLVLPVGEKETVLSFGDTVTVRDETSYVKIYTVALVAAAREGEEESAPEQRRFEIKTIYFSRGSSFSVLQTEAGLRLHLKYGSLSYAYTKDMFGDGKFYLSASDLLVEAGENYLALGVTERACSVFRLGGKSDVNLSSSRGRYTLSGLEGLSFLPGAEQAAPLAAPLTDALWEEPSFGAMSSLLNALTENSAIADGVSRALNANQSGADLNLLLSRGLEYLSEQRAEAARAFSPQTEDKTVCRLSVDDFRAGDFVSCLQARAADTSWLLTYPASTAAFTVEEERKTVNLAALSAEEELEIAITLSIALKDAGDSLALTLGETRFAVNLTEGTSTYLFRLNVGELKALYAADPSEKTLGVQYQTQETYLFVEKENATYQLADTAGLPAAEAGVPLTLEVALRSRLYEGDAFYLLHRREDGSEEKIVPTAKSGAQNTYLFTVTPAAGVNLCEIVCSSLYELTMENGLGTAFAARLTLTAGGGLVSALSAPVLQIYPADESEFVPVVIQKSASESFALTADEWGNYPLRPIGADTTLSLSLGYPVNLPAANDLYTVKPLEGYSADYAARGGEWRFKVELSRTAALGTSILVKNNGVTLTPDAEGVYVIAEVTQPVRLSVLSGVTYNVFLPVGENFTVSPYGGDGTTVLENGTFRFTLQLSQSASVSQLIVSANENVLTPDASGIYTVSGIARDVYISVRLVSAFRVIVPEGDGYTVTPYGESTTAVLSGESFAFTVQTDESVNAGSEIRVYANETLLAPENGVYRISDIQTDIYLQVSLKRAFCVELPADTEAYSVAAQKKTVLYGESFSFSVTPKTAVSLTVYVNGRPLSGVAGTYTVDKVYSDLYVTVSAHSSQESQTKYRVTLKSADLMQITASSATQILPGEVFSFSLLIPADKSESDVRVKTSAGALSLSEKVSEQGGLRLSYTVSGIDKDCEISALWEESSGLSGEGSAKKEEAGA